MKKVLKTMFIIVIIILIKSIFTISINSVVVGNYNRGVYNTSLVKLLYYLDFTESYIAYYNDGNISYKKELYEEALTKYQKAIDRNPPKKRICDVRINLSLAMLKTIDENNTDTLYDELEKAKQNLYNDNCASPTDDSGESKTAEELEEEIKKLQEELEGKSDDSDESEDESDSNSSEETEDYSDVEEKLKEYEKEANSSRQEDLSKKGDRGNYESYYDGKRW